MVTYNSSVLANDRSLYIAGGSSYIKVNEFGHNGRMRRGYTNWNRNNVYEGKLSANKFEFIGDDPNLTKMNIINPWSALPPMKDDRRSFPMVHLDGCLYAIGMFCVFRVL